MMIVLQAFINISVVMGLLPTKGITLPLVSNGGSSLLTSLIAIGVLLNIAQHGSNETERVVPTVTGAVAAPEMGAA
jgi:cell division protein FtsW